MEDITGAVWSRNQSRSGKYRKKKKVANTGALTQNLHSSSNTNTPRFSPSIHAYLDITSRFKLHCSSDGLLTLLTMKISVWWERGSVSFDHCFNEKFPSCIHTPPTTWTTCICPWCWSVCCVSGPLQCSLKGAVTSEWVAIQLSPALSDGLWVTILLLGPWCGRALLPMASLCSLATGLP